MSESPVTTFAPGVEATVVKDTCRVGGATFHLHHTLAFHGFNKARSVNITGRGMGGGRREGGRREGGREEGGREEGGREEGGRREGGRREGETWLVCSIFGPHSVA